MHPLIVHNGRLGPHDAQLSAGQFGLLTGWGVFSTFRIYDGIPFEFERHWSRLAHDAERLRVRLPHAPEEIRRHMLDLIGANGVGNGAARLSFVRNQGGLWSTESERETDFLIFTADLKAWPASARLSVTPNLRDTASPLAGAKILSWAVNVAALEQAQAQGFDETLLLNERGEVSECTAANVFAVRDGVLFTPPLESACLPGVTRAVLLELARAAGIEVREQPMRVEDLHAADEVFITSTTREIMPVREAAGAPTRYDGPVTRQLHAAFREHVRRYVERRRPVSAQA